MSKGMNCWLNKLHQQERIQTSFLPCGNGQRQQPTLEDPHWKAVKQAVKIWGAVFYICVSPTKRRWERRVWRGRASWPSDDCLFYGHYPISYIRGFTPAQRINLISGKERDNLRLQTCFIPLATEIGSGKDTLPDFGQRFCIPQLMKELVILEGMKR